MTPTFPTVGNKCHFLPRESRFLHQTSRRGRRDTGATVRTARDTRERGHGHLGHDPSSPGRKHGTVGSGTRARPAASQPAARVPTDPGPPTPRHACPRKALGPLVWRVGARRATRRPLGGDAARRAEGGGAVTCSDVFLKFRNLGLFHFCINIYQRFHFSREKLTNRLLPPATLTAGDPCVWILAGVCLCPLPVSLPSRRFGSRCEFSST